MTTPLQNVKKSRLNHNCSTENYSGSVDTEQLHVSKIQLKEGYFFSINIHKVHLFCFHVLLTFYKTFDEQ